MRYRDTGLLFGVVLLAIGGQPAFGQEMRSERYDYCREMARDISGYRGAVPAEYRESTNVLEGAAKGAISGAAAGWVTGGDTKKAAKRGAALGFLIAGIEQGRDDQKRRQNESRRRMYQAELQACMAEGR